MKRVVVADDQKELLESLVNILSLNEEIEVVGTATNGEEEIECIKKYNPDVVITDLEMPIKTGLDVIESFVNEENKPTFIVVSGNFNIDTIKRLNELSIMRFSKPLDHEKLIKEILYDESEIIEHKQVNNLKKDNIFVSKIKNLFSK